MNRQSITVSWAIRLAIAPERNVVSRAAVVSTWSATSLIGERGKFVSATVVAPWSLATRSASTVSDVEPVCDIPTATSASVSTAADVSAMCVSFQAKQVRPMRCSFCWRSNATNALAPNP
jgi:hypothetical protein